MSNINKKHEDIINNILDNMKGKRRDRALKIATGQLHITDEEYKQFIYGELLRRKRIVIDSYKAIADLYNYRRQFDKWYKEYEDNGDIVSAAEVQVKIGGIKNLIRSLKADISEAGEYFINILSSDVIDEHEACALFNINSKTWENEKENYVKQFGEEDNLVYKIISICAVEYRWYKGRYKDFYDCEMYEMPIYWAINEHIMQEMRENKELKKATDEKFKEIFGDMQTYRVVTDLEGNVVNIVPNNK